MNEVIIFCNIFIDFKQIWQDLPEAGYELMHLYYTIGPYFLSNSLEPFSIITGFSAQQCINVGGHL